MPSNEPATPPTYTIFIDGKSRRGSAFDLLDGIRRDAASRSEEVARLSTDQYAALIVQDAAFFLDRDLLAYLKEQPYPSDYDRALRYLAEMVSSGVRILAQTAA